MCLVQTERGLAQRIVMLGGCVAAALAGRRRDRGGGAGRLVEQHVIGIVVVRRRRRGALVMLLLQLLLRFGRSLDRVRAVVGAGALVVGAVLLLLRRRGRGQIDLQVLRILEAGRGRRLAVHLGGGAGAHVGDVFDRLQHVGEDVVQFAIAFF